MRLTQIWTILKPINHYSLETPKIKIKIICRPKSFSLQLYALHRRIIFLIPLASPPPPSRGRSAFYWFGSWFLTCRSALYWFGCCHGMASGSPMRNQWSWNGFKVALWLKINRMRVVIWEVWWSGSGFQSEFGDWRSVGCGF